MTLRWARRRHVVVVASVIAAALIIAGQTSMPAHAATVSTTMPRGLRYCNVSSSTITTTCLSGALSDFDVARAKEHLGKLVLPSNFRSLTVPEQLLVLTNLDRVARGLQPFVGLNATLDGYAARGSATRSDPRFPSWTRIGGANWFSGYNALWSEFVWMYEDGPGINTACISAAASGCWGHRANILTAYPAPRVMGAAGCARTGDATLYLGADAHDTTFVFRWSSEARYFPGGRMPRVA